ncbi:uncharacterized protein TNCV_934121 [Trichonephila clavipes]|nr:uncharacterized protein TNCV_934121 [Trichonephila clavipes]
MVWGGIIASGKTQLGFVEEGFKINQKVYQRGILEAVVLPWTQKHLGNANWMFQQDSALDYKAKKTQEMCKMNFPDMISSEEGPPTRRLSTPWNTVTVTKSHRVAEECDVNISPKAPLAVLVTDLVVLSFSQVSRIIPEIESPSPNIHIAPTVRLWASTNLTCISFSSWWVFSGMTHRSRVHRRASSRKVGGRGTEVGDF